MGSKLSNKTKEFLSYSFVNGKNKLLIILFASERNSVATQRFLSSREISPLRIITDPLLIFLMMMRFQILLKLAKLSR